ncbi:MAG: hypothetical protein M3463_13265 [Verrucomicrobiota bacterium]|nr:hypothetical protein [Verrucomicrobiota bacterium]
MPKLRGIISFFLGLLVGTAFALIAYQLGARSEPKMAQRLVRRSALLEDENERLRRLLTAAERATALAANKAQRDAVEKEVVAIRGLAFKQPVDYQVLNRPQIKETIAKKLSELFSEQEFRHMTTALALLGLLPENYPLREKYIDLLGEQVAAFYDQHQHKLFMFEDASLESAQNRVVLAHELTHALQDQHFGLKRLPLEIKTNDDRALAAGALVEGEATLVMSEFMLKNLSLETLKDNLAATLTQNMEQLSKAPRFLRETLMFPYLRGQEFCAAIFGRGGYAAISKAYERPPSSSAQILHPEKYLLDPREEPLEIAWADLTWNGRPAIVDNVVGEFGVRVLVSEWVDSAAGEKAARGWRGDRYLCMEEGPALVWKSRWSSAADADEFLAAMTQVMANRPDRAQRAQRLNKPDATSVVLIDALDASAADALAERFAR